MIPQRRLDVISLNNLAVRSLEQNDISCACEFIAIAVKLIRNQGKIQSSTSQNQLSSNYFSFRWSKNSSLPTQISSSQDPIGHFLFTRGMLISDLRPQNNQNQKCNSNNINTDIGAAIIYNAGLIFQLFAIKKRKFTLLAKAGSFYRSSQTLLRKANERGFKSKLCFNFFFHIALLNNLGQLCYELVDYQSSAYYFDRLQKNLKHLIEKSKAAGTCKRKKTNIYCRADLLGMLSNTIVDIPMTAPTA